VLFVVVADLAATVLLIYRTGRQIQATQVKHGEILARVESELAKMQKDILIVRDWRHVVSNVMAAIVLKLELPLSREGNLMTKAAK
jgi:hypothetical protein